MKLSELYEFLFRAGYKQYPSSGHAVQMLQRRLDLRLEREQSLVIPGCLGNNNQVHVNVLVYERPPSAMIELAGEYREGHWVKIELYTISWPELTTDLSRLELEALAAWRGICTHVGRVPTVGAE